MAPLSFENVDKTIVERPDVHAGDKSRAAVRRLRKGLVNTGGTGLVGKFDLELLRNHAELIKRIPVPYLLSVALGTYLAWLSLPAHFVILWLSFISFIIFLHFQSARELLASDPKQLVPSKWQQRFLLLIGIQGIAWSLLFAVHPIVGPHGAFSFLASTGALVLMCAGLLTTKDVKFGVLAATFPVASVCCVRMVMLGTPASFGMATVLIAAAFFVQHLADIMLKSDLNHLRSAAERDQLILELEGAKGLSEEARRRAEDANLAKSRFLATMSHELRTPLNAILGFSEIMSNEVMGPLENKHYKEYAGDIHSSGFHLLKLINEILDLSRVEAGRYELNEEAINLVQVVDESQHMMKLKASEKDIDMTVQLQTDMPQIWADSRAVRQVTLNLISNALKFTPKGGTVVVKCGWTTGGGQYISVKDTGPGIPEEEVPIILSAFGQGSIAIKSAEQGTGLGLPIVQALAQIHDGSFELKTKLREGTEVIVTFPRKRVMEVVPPVPQNQQAYLRRK